MIPDTRTVFGRAAVMLGTHGLAKGDYVGRPLPRKRTRTIDIRKALMIGASPGRELHDATASERTAYWRAVRMFTEENGIGPAAWGDQALTTTEDAVDELVRLRDLFAEEAA